jgi:phenylalanine-4-hydroxylase
MGATQYDITKYQDILFAAASLNHLEDVVGSFWATCDDDMIDKLRT